MTDAVSKTRLRRTRTGCFKCRVRRRKCDEGKPACQRCVDGGFECQYGTRLSFLEKNAKTSGDPARAAKPSYAKLRFVVPESTAAKPGVQFQEDEATPNEPEKRLSTPVEPKSASPKENLIQQQPEPPALISPSLGDYSATSPHAASGSHELQDPSSYTIGISPSNAAYETALDGLLSLGNDHYVPQSASVTSQVTANGGFFESPNHGQHHATPTQFDMRDDKPLAEIFPNCIHMPQDRAVELLRHYRYHIAPWLDIGDTKQTFGLLVPRIAMDSAPLLDSLLSLSLTTLGGHVEPDFGEQLILPSDPNNSSADILRNALTFAFIALRRHFITPPTSWQSPSKSMGFDSLNSASFQEQHPSVALATSWMMLRLNLSVGLMNGSPVSIPSLISFETSSPMNGIYRESLKYDREPVILCAQVLNYCFGGDVATSPGMIRPTAAQRWKSFSEALKMWYTNRPRDFKPMLEIDDNEQLFPLVLFTNGAAVLANQLYHTSMLLLLQNRPRTLPKEHGRSVYLSPLWHAQRICGISLNNDTRTSWDFSLLASLYLAAKRMTYEPQQHAILRGIDRIGSLTGWNVNALSAQLVHEWQPD
ncbi:Zn(2)-C6 fungal-type domain-containing protein [Fusarium sp. LHS14.1]|nr:Zn(2)-C6 fungal-type domain-containing protein [Fusarium sp. LHS14.1]